jgi:L-xylulose reductase
MVLGHIGPAYCCSKAAMDMMTKTFAVELGSYGIRVNSVNPTLMNTPLILSAEPDTREKSYLSIARAPIHGLLDPSDAANLVLYLSSKNSKMITGSSVPIEGGLLSS